MQASKQANKQTLVVSVSLSFSEKNTKTTEERKTLTEKERKFRKKEMVEKTVWSKKEMDFLKAKQQRGEI